MEIYFICFIFIHIDKSSYTQYMDNSANGGIVPKNMFA